MISTVTCAWHHEAITKAGLRLVVLSRAERGLLAWSSSNDAVAGSACGEPCWGLVNACDATYAGLER